MPAGPVIPQSDVEALQNYLHGKTPEDELNAAAMWEFSRRDQRSLLAAAKFQDEQRHPVRIARTPAKKLREIMTKIGFVGTIAQFKAQMKRDAAPMSWEKLKDLGLYQIWNLPAFPGSNWKNLSNEDKKLVMALYPPVDRPIGVLSYKAAAGVMASSQESISEQMERLAGEPAHRNKPCVCKGYGDHVHMLVTINPTEGVDLVAKRFRAWLEAHGAAVFGGHYKKKKGRGLGYGKLKQALHDLAAWWLWDWLGFDSAKHWTSQHHLDGVVSRGGHAKVEQLNFYNHTRRDGPLYVSRQEWRLAIDRGRTFLKERFGSQRLRFVPAVTPDTPDSPHFHHLAPIPMQIEGFDERLIWRMNRPAGQRRRALERLARRKRHQLGLDKKKSF